MNCIQELKKLLAENMPNETILITPTAGVGRRLLRSCIRGGGIVVGARSMTPISLAGEILDETCPLGEVPVLLSRGEQQDLVFQMLTEMPEEGFFIHEHVRERKTAELFWTVIHELDREGIGPVSGNERLEALQRVRDAYHAVLDYRTPDETGYLRAAIEKTPLCDCFCDTRFVVLSSDIFPAVDRELIEKVAGDRLSVIQVNAPSGISVPASCYAQSNHDAELSKDRFRFWSCRGIRAETEAVMRDILSTGKKAEDCAVVFMGLDYPREIMRSAEELHIPVTISGGIPTSGSSVFAVLHMLDGWPQSDFNAEELRSLILNGILKVPEGIRFASKLRKLNVGWGESRYYHCLEADRENLDSTQTAPYDEWAETLELLFLAAKKSGTIEEQKANLARLLETQIGVRREEDASALALSKVLLNQVAWLEEGESVLGRLLDLLGSAGCMSHQEQPGKLFALPLGEAFCTGRRYLYVCGMSRFCMTGGRAESPVFLDEERKRFGLLDVRNLEELNTFRLLMTLSEHGGEAVLSYNDYDTDRMIHLEPALLYRELLGNREPECISMVPMDRYSIGDRVAAGEAIQVAIPDSCDIDDETVPAALKPEKSYEQQLEETVFSASSLETALDCPFKFYADKMLHLKADAIPEKSYDRWLAVNDFGTLCHAVLARYYSEQTNDWHAILNEEVEKMKETLPSGTEAAVNADIREAEDMISRAITWTESEARTVIGTEVGFGPRFGTEPLEIDFNGKTIRMSGSIDRVDRLSDGSISIIDYKTGKPDHYRENIEKKLQPYLYARAAERLDQDLQVKKAGYLFLKNSAFYLQAWKNAEGESLETNKVSSLLEWISSENGALTDAPDFTFKTDGTIDGFGNREEMLENCWKYCDYPELCAALRMMNEETGEEVLDQDE